MPVQPTAVHVAAPYNRAHPANSFPKYVFSTAGPRRVETLAELTELVEVAGPGVWFDKPADVPAAPEKVSEDWKSKFEASEAKNTELRQMNGDLLVKLALAKPEVKPDAPKPVK